MKGSKGGNNKKIDEAAGVKAPLVDPKKLVKIEPGEMMQLVGSNKVTVKTNRELMSLERMCWVERKRIHAKLDVIEEETEKFTKRLQEKYKYIGKISNFNMKTNELILE